MGNLGHQAARLAASKICDNIVKGLCKDPETEVVKLIDMWQKFMGDEKIDLNYDSARKMICDKDCTLNKVHASSYQRDRSSCIKDNRAQSGL